MLSSFLPGQEAGNVPFVVRSGFGEFSRKPKVLADDETFTPPLIPTLTRNPNPALALTLQGDCGDSVWLVAGRGAAGADEQVCPRRRHTGCYADDC